MSVYLDAPVLMSIIASDANSEKAGRWYGGVTASVIVSDLANLEVCAVISREHRAKRFSRAAAEKALSDFDALRAASDRLCPGPQDYALADRLIRDFESKLMAADALHLASAKNVAAGLATFDVRLADAARKHGVEVIELA
jgi:predicted nucleic acid-binding protein